MTQNSDNSVKKTKKKAASKQKNALSKSILIIITSSVILFLAIATSIYNITLALDECSNQLVKLQQKSDLRTYSVYGTNTGSGFLSNVFEVLKRLGYVNTTSDDWDLLWAHNYPFRTLYPKLNNLKPHQKVNHFPGCGYITNKVDLATSNLEYIPKAFRLPVDKLKLLAYSEDNPSVKFVQKNNDHRNIKVKNVSDIELDEEGTFVQEFVEKPLLVGGYKFDIGVYTIITSIDPLRVYIYNGDALLRFCPVKYYPFDPTNVDKYVVGDDYLPTWEVPELKYYYNTLKFGMKESLNAHLRSNNLNPDLIWDKIEDAIRIVTLNKEPKIAELFNRFASKHNFFEMMRFDFVVDENLNIYLMEANMSPNLSSAHFPPNKLLFEQIIYNLLGLVGVGERIRKNSSQTWSNEGMLTSQKNVAVFSKECGSELCKSGCVSPTCQLCRTCLSEDAYTSLTRAYKEHVNRGDCKRIFPPPMKKSSKLPTHFEDLSNENQLMYKWFLGKCISDVTWCN